MTTNIEWCDETWNPCIGCHAVHTSSGCRSCYALAMARRQAGQQTETGLRYRDALTPPPRAQWNGSAISARLERRQLPMHWKKPKRIFVNSMGDWTCWRAWQVDQALKVMHACPQHRFLALTKWPGLLDCLLYTRVGGEIMTFGRYLKKPHPISNMTCRVGLKNLWLGLTVCNQEEADAKIPVFLQSEAARFHPTFLCLEPLLGPVDISSMLSHLSWVIVGGETGPGARYIDPRWVFDIRDQCADAGVPFFFKSWGSALKFSPSWPAGETPREIPEALRFDGEEA